MPGWYKILYHLCMSNSKTGAVICKKPAEEKMFRYEALLFITDIPHYVTDDELEAKIKPEVPVVDVSKCPEIIYRADIHATSNEVQEQFENLHLNEKPVRRLKYTEINGSVND